MYEEKLSIIIPTKNRQIYAFKCVETILKKIPEGYEIVIMDNSDDDSLKGMLSQYIDGTKLKYAYESKCLSFCDNFERGVIMSSGDYITMIGDDDCVLPEIIQLTDIARRKGIDAVTFPTCYSYYWPNAIVENEGRLVVRKQRPYVEKLYTKNALEDMKKEGNYDYQQYNFPKVYHGIVKRDKFDLVKEKAGCYFGGLTPDIYSAIALHFYIDKILYINTPFTLPGICARSGSADSLTGRHTGELSNAPHFRGHVDYKWEEDIPYIYSVDTIWAETAFKAVKDCGGDISLSNEEYFSFLTYIIGRCPMFKDRMIDFYVKKTGFDAKKVEKRFDNAIKKQKRIYWLKKGYSFGMQLLRGRHKYEGVNDIESAMEIVKKDGEPYGKAFKLIEKINW